MMTQRRLDLFLDILANMTQNPDLKLNDDFLELFESIQKYLCRKFYNLSEKQIDLNTTEQLVLLRHLLQNPSIFGGASEKQKDPINTYFIIHQNGDISVGIQAINYMNAVQQDRWVTSRLDQIAVIDVDANTIKFLSNNNEVKKFASKIYCDFLMKQS